MSRFIAFLRAINVGSGRTVKMESLHKVFEALGFSGIATFVASGNVIFETRAKNTRMLERKIERRLREVLGYEVATFVRTSAEVVKIANYEPFPQSKISTAAEVNIILLANPLDEKTRQKVMALSTDTDEFRIHGREIYWLRRKKRNGFTFSNVPHEKTISEPFTIRGSRTMKRIAAKYGPGNP